MDIEKMEANLHHMISWGLDQLKEAHESHVALSLNTIMGDVERGDEQALIHDVVVSVYKLLEPVIDMAREAFPHLFALIDWACDIVKKINAALADA